MDRNIWQFIQHFICKLFLGPGTRLSLVIKINITLRNESSYERFWIANLLAKNMLINDATISQGYFRVTRTINEIIL